MIRFPSDPLAQRSLRAKFILASVIVEVCMLAVLLVNSQRLIVESADHQINAQLDTARPLLNAALGARLLERDYAALNEMLATLVLAAGSDIRYIVVRDERQIVFASIGVEDPELLPDVDDDLSGALGDLVYDAAVPLTIADQRVGEARFGLSLAAAVSTRNQLLTQSLAIGTAAVILGIVLLTLTGRALTGHIQRLVVATRRMAAGDYANRVSVPGRDEVGQLAGHFNVMVDAVQNRIEALRRSERALAEEKERAVVTLESIADGVITTDVSGRITSMNPVAVQLTGWSECEAQLVAVEDIYRVSAEDANEPLPNPVRQCLEHRSTVRRQDSRWLVARDGRRHPIEDTASLIVDRDGQTLGAVLVIRDIGVRREMALQLEHQARHDALTGLVNRREFEQRVEAAIAAARTRDQSHVMCYLDLDQFKVVNDTCGHSAGDELLRQLAGLLRGKVRDTDVVARLGGDEFGVLLHKCPVARGFLAAESLRDAIRAFRFAWEGRSFQVGVSIGLVPIASDSGPIAEVFAAADVACYIAKDSGGNRIHRHQPDDIEDARRRGDMHWSTHIVSALDEDRFVLHFQRIVPIRGDDHGFPRCELLVRMLEEDRTIIPPGRFLAAAERYQHIARIDHWVLRRALAQLTHSGNPLGADCFSLNISGQSLGDAGFLARVLAEIGSSGIDPARLCFEITETAAIGNMGRAMEFMAELRRLGCRFALDDFGSGLSSFSYLKSLPVDFLKIDGSFIRNLPHNASDRAMVNAIQQVARAVGVQTIAEFIESEATVEVLREIGIDYGQGYAIHAPESLAPGALAALPGLGLGGK